MKNTTNTIKSASLALLKELQGKLVQSVSIDYGEKLDHALSQMVILHCQDCNVSFWTSETENRPDEYPDLSEITVQKETDEHLALLKTHLVSFAFCQKITNIEEMIEYVTINKPNEPPFILTNTKAILIHFNDHTLVLEKNCHWSECWTVTLHLNNDEYIFHDQWKNRADDDNASYTATIKRKVI